MKIVRSDATDRDLPIRGQMRVAGYRRVSHGLFLVTAVGLSQQEELRRDLRAWLMVLPANAVFTHVTGAMLRGWWLPRLPEQTPVFAAVEGNGRRPRRPGLICSRLRRETSSEVRHGLPVERAEEILLRAARDLGLLDLLVMLESALQLKDIDHDRMTALLRSRRPGVGLLREAWRRATGKAESAGEVVLQLFHSAIQVLFRAQEEIFDDEGRLRARADLYIPGTTRLHEYDGEVHRTKSQHRADLRRDRGLHGTGYLRFGYTLDDLLNHAVTVMYEIDDALGRAHLPSRLARWRRIIDCSLYSEVGRERIMNRWHRQMGTFDWSQKS